jgi:branched-chain amino acid aminotransferase
MSDIMLDNFIYNGIVYNTPEFEKLYVERHPSIYEVIRIMDGVPLFLEEHYDRLQNSSKLLGYDLKLSFEDVKKSIMELIKLNNVKNYNIKIVVNGLRNNDINEYFFFIKSSYPSEDLYKQGIKTFTYKAVRENPNAKVINQSLRNEINRLLKEKDCYEALLVNHKGEITEGSRSNAFFIKEGKVYTAPAKDVLLGITRKRIMDLCKQNGIDVLEVSILERELSSFEAAFISGTSPKVLPISKIDTISLSVNNDTLQKIIKIYDDEIEKYINSHK